MTPPLRYVTREEMQEIDRRAIEERKIPVDVLMGNAGKAVADLVVDRLRAELDGLRSLEPSCVNGGDQHMLTVPQLLRCPCRGCAEYLDYRRLEERSRPLCVHRGERAGLPSSELRRCPCGMCARWVADKVRRSKLGVVGVTA